MLEFLTLRLASITESTTNPRRHFDPVKLQELTDSIKSRGVLQPILVRPLPGARVAETDRAVEYEIVAGARRFRASQLAGLGTIPAMLCHLDDNAALEAAILENLQRDDLSALEEAEGYEALCVATGISKDEVGAKIGKSRSYVYARLKLLDLSMECKDALRTGSIDFSRAEKIARIPDTALQLKALAEATRKGGNGDVISVRDLQTWLQKNVMLRLETATFKITDSRLVKEAGSCKDCPKRTGANPDLFADVDGADICTDPPCFHGKEDVHRAILVEQAEKKGLRLVDGKEAAEICSRFSSNLKGYLPLSQVREDAASPHGHVDTSVHAPTLRDLLGKDAPGAVLIEHPYTREMIEAVPEEEAEALLIARGLIKATRQQMAQENETQKEIEYLRESTTAQIERATRAAKYKAVIDAIRATPDAKAAQLITSDLLRAWMESILGDTVEPEDMADMLGYTIADGLDEMDAISMHLRACSHGALFRALVIYMVSDDKPNRFRSNDQTILKALFQPLAIDISSIEAEAKADIKAEVAEKIKALKALITPTKPLLPLASAAQAKVGGGKSQEGAKNQSPAAPARKRKMSSDEAQAAIAAAMQDQETDSGANAQGDDASLEPGSGCALPVGVPASEAASGIDEAQYATATNLVVIQQVASISRLQRLLGIGYNAAARMIERMETEGIVGPMLPNGTRPVLQPSPIEVAVDPLYQSALDLIVRDQKVNVRLLKSELKIGTAKAMELVAQLEQAGKVSACDERGARKVLVVV